MILAMILVTDTIMTHVHVLVTVHATLDHLDDAIHDHHADVHLEDVRLHVNIEENVAEHLKDTQIDEVDDLLLLLFPKRIEIEERFL